MGGQSSKKTSYEDECRHDPDKQSFDATLQDRMNRANTIAYGVEVRPLSFDSLKEVTGCILEMNQYGVKTILECKQDVCKNKKLQDLVNEFIRNSSLTLEFGRHLEEFIKRSRDRQLIINFVIQQFEKEDAEGANKKKYVRTLEELKKFKTSGNSFTEELSQIFRSFRDHQLSMLKKLQNEESKLDKKLKSVKASRKVSSIIFVTIFVAVWICSVVATVMAHPDIATRLADANLIPISSMEKWIDSFWKKYEDELKGQKDVFQSMKACTDVTINEVVGIWDIVERLKIEMTSLLNNADFTLEEEEAVKLTITEFKKKLPEFTENLEDLDEHVHRFCRDIREAMKVVNQTITNQPNN